MFPGVCIAIPHRRDNGKQFSMRRSVLMEPRSLEYMTLACDGRRLSGLAETLVRRVCTDSRQVQRDDLFVALRGERFDGHAFVAEAADRGVAGVVVEYAGFPSSYPPCAVIAVENTRAALGRIAARYRRDFELPVIAVAGSNGKTTAKELIAALLRQRYRTLASRASFNNEIGVPATLLELEREHEVAVLECGTNHPGELAPLLQLAQPRFGVLTSLGREHLEFFVDLAGVIREEGCLAESLPAQGRLFLNGDMADVNQVMRRSAAPVVRVGLGEDNDWRAGRVQMDESGISFEVRCARPGFNRGYRLPLLGRHQVINALLAMAVGAELGLDAEEVQRGLAGCVPVKMRLQPWALNGVQFLDDTYNANADSMRAALDTLQEFPCRGRRVAVLGDMAELGSTAWAAHAEIGHYAAAHGVQHLLAVGHMAGVLGRAAQEAGLSSVEQFRDLESAAEALGRYIRPGDVVLLKASRALGLERIGEWLRLRSGPGGGTDWDPRPNSLGKR
jgi:UDP-N-acetylmuramoyl-tripeptide--D-alanyl-D-alanine ligase